MNERGPTRDPDTPRTGDVRRRAERFDVAGVRCRMGRVADYSADGMRVVSTLPWAEGVARFVTLRAGKQRARVRARCVWRRREGLLRWVHGVRFDDPNRWRVQAAVDLARSHRVRSAPHAARRAA